MVRGGNAANCSLITVRSRITPQYTINQYRLALVSGDGIASSKGTGQAAASSVV